MKEAGRRREREREREGEGEREEREGGGREGERVVKDLLAVVLVPLSE